MTDHEFDICTCGCHQPHGGLHMFPCCYPCPKCGERILVERYKLHETRCKKKPIDPNVTPST
jgi:hypothetical protein